MKNNLSKYSLLTLILFSMGCGGAVGVSTEIETDPNPATLATRFQNSVSALIPAINDSEISTSLTPDMTALTYGSSSGWATYLTPENATVITDIFGSASEMPNVVTKIRVLTEQFTQVTSQILSADPDFDCTGTTALTSGDTVTIAFYGAISNGTSSDRAFDCVFHDANETIIYGEDASHIRRFVHMSDSAETNTESPEVRGNQKRVRQVVYTTYAENTSEGLPVTYVDLQYAQITSYNGVDVSYGTSDDVIFKSRSRISGRVALTGSGNISSGAGEFQVTKYDSTAGNTNITQVMGRGNFGSGNNAIFKINSDMGELSSAAGTYCLQMSSGSTPSSTASSNCSSLESGYAWNTTFPFTLSPALPTTFESKSFFQGNDTDMISNTGSNFTIPTY